MYLEIFHYWTVMTEAVRPGVDQSSTTVVLVLLLPLLLHDHYESQPGPRSEHSEISRPVSGLSSYSLVHPAPHQPVVVVKVSDVRQHRLVIDVVVVVPRTVVTPGLLPPPLASLRLEALFGRLLGISDGEERLVISSITDLTRETELPWTGFYMIWNLKLRLATLAVLSLSL